MYSMRANQTVGGDFQDSGSRCQNNLSIYAAVLSSEESNRILGVCGAAKIDCSMPKQRRSAPSASNRVVCNCV